MVRLDFSSSSFRPQQKGKYTMAKMMTFHDFLIVGFGLDITLRTDCGCSQQQPLDFLGSGAL